jgi:hypothetical protein
MGVDAARTGPPRQYASIVCSGVLGLGSTREQDIRAVKRLHDALLPGGTLVLDNDEQPFRWKVREWNEPSGAEIALRSRVDAVHEDDRCVHMTIRAEAPDGRCEDHTLTMRFWPRDELVPLLRERASSPSTSSKGSTSTRASTSPTGRLNADVHQCSGMAPDAPSSSRAGIADSSTGRNPRNGKHLIPKVPGGVVVVRWYGSG